MNKKVDLNRFPGGRGKALTMSYDDGVVQDEKLIEIFNRYGIKGSFHLNSGVLSAPGYVKTEDVERVYRGHEISVHGLIHQALAIAPREKILEEVLEDRKALENLTGRAVRGMSYAYGSVSKLVRDMLPHLGIEYARGTGTTEDFTLPEDFLHWRGTCHHKNRLMELGRKFLESKINFSPALLYVWGHSYEFDNDANWNLIEEFARMVGGRDDIWFCTNIEIVDYTKAVQALRFTADQRVVENPMAMDVWISVAEETVRIPGGTVVRL